MNIERARQNAEGIQRGLTAVLTVHTLPKDFKELLSTIDKRVEEVIQDLKED